jgi:carbonic anhydrase/acetyltransferase-like protein (isoleucine patch superfamily)
MPVYEFAGKRPAISPDAFVHPEAVIIGEATIGKGCFVGPGAVIRADFGPVSIGDGSTLQDNAVIHVSPGDVVVVESNVIIAHSVVLHDVHIRSYCIVGMGAILLQKVICEECVMVAAGSVVPHAMHVPPWKLIAGNPARIVRDLPQDFRNQVKAGLETYRLVTENYRETLRRL